MSSTKTCLCRISSLAAKYADYAENVRLGEKVSTQGVNLNV